MPFGPDTKVAPTRTNAHNHKPQHNTVALVLRLYGAGLATAVGHKRMVASPEPEAYMWPCGWKRTACTGPWWPLLQASSAPECKSYIFTHTSLPACHVRVCVRMHVAGVARWSRFAHLLLCTHRHKLALCRVQRRSIELDIECVGVPHVIALGIKESHLREVEKGERERERARGDRER